VPKAGEVGAICAREAAIRDEVVVTLALIRLDEMAGRGNGLIGVGDREVLDLAAGVDNRP
jgi:hypothetical protein